MRRPTFALVCLFLLLLTSAVANGQEFAMDIQVVAGGEPGVVDVQVFSSNPQTASFEIRFRSDTAERVVTSTTLQTSVSGLISGKPYIVSAVGRSAAGAITETTPDESIVAP